LDLGHQVLQNSLPQEQLAAPGRQLLGDLEQLVAFELLLLGLDIQHLLQTPYESPHRCTEKEMRIMEEWNIGIME
jgi:hypothetical protein